MMKQFIQHYKQYIYTFGSILLVIVVACGTWSLLHFATQAQKPVVRASTANSVSQLNTCIGKTFDCYNNYLIARTKTDGPAAAMADIRQAFNTDSYVKAQCHQLTHVVGREAIKKYKTVKDAFQHGDSFCWSGYYHGAVEEAIKDIGADKIRSQANDICSGFAAAKRYSFDHYNCVHGMGHGFMSVEDLNLFHALNDCDLLHDNWEQLSCYGGVFMENIMIEARGEGKSAYLKPDQPMYPCTAVDTAYKEQCYLMQTSYVLQNNQYNFAATFQQCHNLTDKAFIATCYQSVGRDASGSTGSDVSRTKANCEQGINSESLMNCMLGAVRDFISYYHSDTQAKLLCQVFDADIAARCQQEVVTYYATFR